jgi:O-antigen ligase
VQNRVDLVRKYLLILYIFTIPLSTAINNILFGFLILFWIIWGDKKKTINQIKQNPIVVAFIILFAIFAISFLWSQNTNEAIKLIKKESFYLALPIFISLMKKDEIESYIKSFLSAMFISEFLSYLIFFNIVPPFLHATKHDPVPFMGPTGHISYNPMLVLSIYLLIFLFFKSKSSKIYKAISAIFIITMTINLFITGGRAGQVAFFFMLIVISLQYFKFSLKSFLATIALIVAIFFTAYSSSKIFHQRVNLAISDIKNYKTNKHTSVGMRIATWDNSLRIIKDNPIFGAGIGDFGDLVKSYSKKYTPDAIMNPQPHNMYLFAWVNSGIFALLALLAIFIFQIRAAFVIDDKYKPIRVALPILYLIIMFSESYLSIHYTKILFLIFSAMLFIDLKWSDLKKPHQSRYK